jgi:hypothetical protein
MLRVTVTEVILDEAQIVAAIGEIKAARVAQHMGPDGWQASARRSAGNQVIHGLPGERLPAFGDEQPRKFVGARGEVPLDCPQPIHHWPMLEPFARGDKPGSS